MKKKCIWILIACVLAAAVLIGVSASRTWKFRNGREQGYLDGYAAGYVDGNGGEIQDFQILSQESNPYAFGGSKWKGYIRGFDIGYSAGYADAQEE